MYLRDLEAFFVPRQPGNLLNPHEDLPICPANYNMVLTMYVGR
jgi:hypothetical protein